MFVQVVAVLEHWSIGSGGERKKRSKEGIEFASQPNGNRYPKEVKVKAPLELLELGVHEREGTLLPIR